jgi:hypothetical protein
MPIRPIQVFKRLTLVLITLVLCWAAYYFYHQGFGQHWRALLAKEFYRFGLEIRVSRLTLDPFRGLVAKNLEIYGSDRRQTVLAQISDLSLDINYANLFQQEPALNAVDLRDAKISIPIDPAYPKAGRIRVTGIQSRIYFFPGRIEVRQASGVIFGIQLQASGTLVNPADFMLAKGSEPAHPEEKPQETFVRGLIKEIETLHFLGEPPQLGFTFQVDLANPSSLRLQGGRLFAQTLTRMHYQLRDLDCQFALENQRFDLQKLFVRDAHGELFATGNWNLGTGEKNFQIRSGLNLGELLADDPRFAWAKDLKFDAPPEIELSGVAQPDGHLRFLGKLNFEQFSVKSVKFQSMKAEFSKAGDRWMISNAQLTHRSGTLSADVLNLPGNFRVRVNSALNPTELMPLCTARIERALADWEFQTSPVIQGTFSGAAPELAKISGTGEVWLGKTEFRGAHLNSASASFHLQDNIIRCDQVQVIRDEGSGTGRFAYDLGHDQVTIEDLSANLYPGVVADWLDPSIGRILQPFHFTDPPTVHAGGTIHVKTGSTNDLHFRIDTSNRFTYHFEGCEIPFGHGSADFFVLKDNRTNLTVSGTISVFEAKVGGSKLFALLLNRLKPLGFREPVDLNLRFRSDSDLLRLIYLELVSGSHAARLSGSLRLSGGTVDFYGNVDGGNTLVRGLGTIRDPIWQLISASRR